MSRGQPTKYRAEYCQMLIDHMSDGHSYESFAAIPRVHLDTLYQWEKDNPEFSEAKKTARVMQLLANEKMMRDIAKGKIRNANATAAIFIMKNCHKWKDRHEVEFTTPDKMTVEELKAEAEALLRNLGEN